MLRHINKKKEVSNLMYSKPEINGIDYFFDKMDYIFEPVFCSILREWNLEDKIIKITEDIKCKPLVKKNSKRFKKMLFSVIQFILSKYEYDDKTIKIYADRDFDFVGRFESKYDGEKTGNDVFVVLKKFLENKKNVLELGFSNQSDMYFVNNIIRIVKDSPGFKCKVKNDF